MWTKEDQDFYRSPDVFLRIQNTALQFADEGSPYGHEAVSVSFLNVTTDFQYHLTEIN